MYRLLIVVRGIDILAITEHTIRSDSRKAIMTNKARWSDDLFLVNKRKLEFVGGFGKGEEACLRDCVSAPIDQLPDILLLVVVGNIFAKWSRLPIFLKYLTKGDAIIGYLKAVRAVYIGIASIVRWRFDPREIALS